MRVRVYLRSLRSNKHTVVPAPLNTGFTSDELNIYIPRGIARELGLWSPPRKLCIGGAR